MTRPDPVEEKLRDMGLDIMRWAGLPAPENSLPAMMAEFKRIGLTALLADNQSKDERMAELEGALVHELVIRSSVGQVPRGYRCTVSMGMKRYTAHGRTPREAQDALRAELTAALAPRQTPEGGRDGE